MMKKDIRFLLMMALSASLLACQPEVMPDNGKDDPKDDPIEDVTPAPEDTTDQGSDIPEMSPFLGTYDQAGQYAVLKMYVDRKTSPDFKLGAAIPVWSFSQKSDLYKLAVENFDEMTPENAMKYSSVVGDDGRMDFTQVRNFVDLADQAGMTLYGHTLAWHSQQRPKYLNGLIADILVESPSADELILDEDFNDGKHPFIHWGNNSGMALEDGSLKFTNPSVVEYWETQFAYDSPEAFENGRKYRVEFRIKGSAAGTLSAGFQIIDGYQQAGNFPNVSFNTSWQDVCIECTCNKSGAERLVFSYGSFVGDLYIDDFKLTALSSGNSYVPMPADQKKAVLTEAMEKWIDGMMAVTAKKVSAWDVVNEAISDRDHDGDGYYDLQSLKWGTSDNFYWQDHMGSIDYVRIAVALARKYYAQHGGTEPLKLFINDYNLESDWDGNKKLKSLINWIEKWEADGVTRIDGIATQMHISYYENMHTQASKEKHVEEMLRLMAQTGKLVKISELDMGYVNSAGTTLTASQLTLQQHMAMAGFYEFIVRKYLEIVPPAQQYGITLWCPLDSPDQSGAWRRNEPTGLWDRTYNRKYAYAGFANGLSGYPPAQF